MDVDSSNSVLSRRLAGESTETDGNCIALQKSAITKSLCTPAPSQGSAIIYPSFLSLDNEAASEKLSMSIDNSNSSMYCDSICTEETVALGQDVFSMLGMMAQHRSHMLKLVASTQFEGLGEVARILGVNEYTPLPFTKAQSALTCTDPANPNEILKRVDGGVDLEITDDEIDFHLQRAQNEAFKNEMQPSRNDQVPLTGSTLSKHPEYAYDKGLEYDEWKRRFLEDVRSCILRNQIHNCGAACYKTRKAKEKKLCRYRYNDTVFVYAVEGIKEAVVHGKPLRTEVGINEDGRVASARDHPFVANYHPVITAALRTNCDVQALAISVLDEIDKIKEGFENQTVTATEAKRAARDSFLDTARNAIVIAYYISTYVTKPQPSASPLYDALICASNAFFTWKEKQKGPTKKAKEDDKEAQDKQKAKEKHAGHATLLTKFGQQLNRCIIRSGCEMASHLIQNSEEFSTHETWMLYLTSLKVAADKSRERALGSSSRKQRHRTDGTFYVLRKTQKAETSSDAEEGSTLEDTTISESSNELEQEEEKEREEEEEEKEEGEEGEEEEDREEEEEEEDNED